MTARADLSCRNLDAAEDEFAPRDQCVNVAAGNQKFNEEISLYIQFVIVHVQLNWSNFDSDYYSLKDYS